LALAIVFGLAGHAGSEPLEPAQPDADRHEIAASESTATAPSDPASAEPESAEPAQTAPAPSDSAPSDSAPSDPAPNDSRPPTPTISILTMGPGTHPFFKFGHNALLVSAPHIIPQVYNYGTFAFDSPALIPKFIMGRFNYWLSRGSEAEALWVYTNANRQIESQQLNLSPAQRDQLFTNLSVNVREENRYYLYDYFRDNCSTRVRDALDVVLEGQLSEAFASIPGRLTYREHALRLTADVLWEYVALHFVLGGVNDKKLTLWEETFIPEVLQEAVRHVTVADSTGHRIPLVAQDTVVFQADRPPPLSEPPARALYFLLVGMCLGGVLAVLGWVARKIRFVRIAFGLALSALGLVTGLLGAILVALWFFTDHTAVANNENILLCGPWMLALVWFGLGVTFVRPGAAKRAYKLSRAVIVICLLSVLAKLVPGFRQDNLAFVLFFVPLWCGTALGLWFLIPHLRTRKNDRPSGDWSRSSESRRARGALSESRT